jgi:dTDP-4-amino-4,6-dideoxygalactose transaminase
VPFLRPSVVRKEAYLQYLAAIDDARWYSNYGPLNTEFERRVRERWFQGRGAVTTVCNATIGLMLAIAESRRPGARYAVMPSFTFAATPLAAMWCGLTPYFVDVRPGDWCPDETQVARLVDELGSELAVVVPYATFGTALDLAPYARLVERGVPVVVDAAPGFGTRHLGRYYGDGFPGTVVFSLHATKAFGIGEGGLVYSADPARIARVRQAANFGFSDAREALGQGLNGKLPELGAAVALATLDDYPAKTATRRRIDGWYRQLFAEHGLLARGFALQQTVGEVPTQFLSAVCPPGRPRAEILGGLAAGGIECRTYFSPACHEQAAFRQAPRQPLPLTEDLAPRILSLPLWEEMTEADVSDVVRELARA